ncbi:hypothetical protein [Neobacillus fumarioli]|nr:hypothetical protein [Neobacillus fumarioli]
MLKGHSVMNFGIIGLSDIVQNAYLPMLAAYKIMKISSKRF